MEIVQGFLFGVLILIGFGYFIHDPVEKTTEEKAVKEYLDNDAGDSLRVYVDKTTGCEYLSVKIHYTGITPRRNTNGDVICRKAQ